MQWLRYVIFGLWIVFSPFSFAHQDNNHDLTHFDHPFLLGDWSFVNPYPEKTPEGFRAIQISLRSDYRFQIEVNKQDRSVQHWTGVFEPSEEKIDFYFSNGEQHSYVYQGSHNTLMMNNIYFHKTLPDNLAGRWASQTIKNLEHDSPSTVKHIDLLIKPDFVFLFRSVTEKGDETLHQGIFYTEQDHLVFMYENGQHDTKYLLNQDTLTLNVEDGALLAVLNRVE
ncbi:hypothetical protein [Vibrio palustris]|uniref:WD40 repeat protein n=1 Tax=Vibrio palustris TaxID=1918946 RepID=A0A1R4B2G0_9VIBR|nr:hypothetical protein [Vibrio palustris]SJL83098.1 hypothetical protein VPAL9027_01047 [Vibrio palustris]